LRKETDAEARKMADKETWVQCDKCKQWRRVPVEIVEALSDDDEWFCRQNPDRKFDSCKVPQEMSDREINRQLGIDSEEEKEETGEEAEEEEEEEGSSSESEEPGTPPRSRDTDRKPAVWQLTRQNIFVTRKRKMWKDEEVGHFKLGELMLF
jgi:hypothetical protein